MATSIKLEIFWDVILCTLVDTDKRFRAAYCLHHHDPDDEGSSEMCNISADSQLQQNTVA
jgi:hypothetical protein